MYVIMYYNINFILAEEYVKFVLVKTIHSITHYCILTKFNKHFNMKNNYLVVIFGFF